MANTNEIGIDLGTTKVMIYKNDEGIILNEPSVVAYDANSGDPIAFGENAFLMVGKTHKNIVAEFPLKNGVISNYTLTKEMVKYFLDKSYNSKVVKPKVCICIPSAVTGIEEKAVVDAAVSCGARQIFLIEEPIAAALGAGIDILKANGNIIVDIGGGTTDIAVISMGGIVCKKSIKIAGNTFDAEISKALKNKYGFMAGGPMYYIERGLGIKWLAKLFALFGVLVAFFGIGTFPQINAITHAMQDTFNVPVIITATVVTVLVAMIILGGVRRIARASAVIVPFMALGYVTTSIIILITINYLLQFH